MADADTNTNTSQNAGTKGAADGTEGNKAFAEVQEQLRQMNTRMEEMMAATAAANQRNAPPPPKQEEENLYDPQTLLRRAEHVFDTRLRAEKQKDMTIYNLAQEYPEIQTDAKVRQAVLDAQKIVPEAIRDTSEGYQLAVLQATSRAGLIPKSQRKTVDDDVSYEGTRRQSQAPKKRNKVSDATVMAAQLMGRNTDDPEVMKRLEEATNRDTYTKYR